jgi:hypothetical protein
MMEVIGSSKTLTPSTKLYSITSYTAMTLTPSDMKTLTLKTLKYTDILTE